MIATAWIKSLGVTWKTAGLDLAQTTSSHFTVSTTIPWHRQLAHISSEFFVYCGWLTVTCSLRPTSPKQCREKIQTIAIFMNAYDCRTQRPTITTKYKCFPLGAQIYETHWWAPLMFSWHWHFTLKIAGAAGVLGSHSHHPNA